MLAALLICSVIGISDGDTLSARCVSDGIPQTVTVRLAEVDAPEKAQPYGARSKQNLSALCFQKLAQVRAVSVDRHGLRDRPTLVRLSVLGTGGREDGTRV